MRNNCSFIRRIFVFIADFVSIVGNLDPQDLYKPQEEIAQLTKEMVKKFGKHRYIANLGHGITPLTPVESMTTFVNSVHTAFD